MNTKGIWALWTANQLPPQQFYKLDFVEGLAMRVSWNAIQPTATRVNFAAINQVAKDCAKAGKGLSLNVICGQSTPRWVNCPRVFDAPIPWNAAYLNALENLIIKLSNAFDHGSTFLHVKLNGVNYESGEMALPSTQAAVNTLIQNGYSVDNLNNTMLKIALMWRNHLPQTEYVLPIQNLGLPRVPPDTRNPTFTIVETLSAKLGRKFILANHGLSATWNNSYVEDFARGGGNTGYQLKSTITGDWTYRMNNGMEAKQTWILEAALERCKQARGKYCEVYNKDVLNPFMYPILRKYVT